LYAVRALHRLKRTLLSLSEVSLRVEWLRDRLSSWSAVEAALLLNELCEENERSEPEAREALIAVAVLFAGLGECATVETLRHEADARSLLSLERLLRKAPPPTHVDRRTDDLPVPDYGVGRELTVGERRSLARRPNRRAFERLLSDPHPLVIRQLLKNPMLTEEDVLRLAARRPARFEVMREIARFARWLSRPRVRMSILLNPGSPPEIAMPLLALCHRGELAEVLESSDTSTVLRLTALELLERRPPLEQGPSLLMQ
jgi:hypothetical protein